MQTRENKGQTKLPFSQSQDKDNNKESLARQSHIKNCQIAAVAAKHWNGGGAKVRRWCNGATASQRSDGRNGDDWDLFLLKSKGESEVLFDVTYENLKSVCEISNIHEAPQKQHMVLPMIH